MNDQELARLEAIEDIVEKMAIRVAHQVNKGDGDLQAALMAIREWGLEARNGTSLPNDIRLKAKAVIERL